MHVFIDESGNFRPRDGTESRISVVAALVVPSRCRVRLYEDYARLRVRLWAQDVEPKGSQLEPFQARQVLELVARHNAIVDACLVDAGKLTSAIVQQFQLDLASSLVSSLDGSPAWFISAMTRASEEVSRLSAQLFVQCWCMVLLIHRLLQTIPSHFVWRHSAELGRFLWIVDPKDHEPTGYERAWKGLILPLISELTRREPIVLARAGNYSRFKRFESAVPADLLAGLPPQRSWDKKAVNTRAILDELSFPNSEDCPGLQLADMVASILCRAMNGNLESEGWRHLGHIMVRDAQDRVFQSFQITAVGSERADLTRPQQAVVNRLVGTARWRIRIE
jgi:hypothetical protein